MTDVFLFDLMLWIFNSKVDAECMSSDICIHRLHLSLFSVVGKHKINACVILSSVLNPCHSDHFSQMFHYLHLMRSLFTVFFLFVFFVSSYWQIFPLLLKSSCLMFAISLPPQFCGAVMSEMDVLLPLAAACNESSLLQVRSSFIESCGRAAFAMLGRLQERALEVPSSAPLKNLHALLATCIYVHQRLEHYSARLKDSSTAAAKM